MVMVARLSAASALAAAAALCAAPAAVAFAPPSPLTLRRATAPRPEPYSRARTPTAAALLPPSGADLDLAASTLSSALSSQSSAPLLAFADQGGNLAGTFFMASLPPYLAFLYFLGFRANRAPDLGKFGWAYLLLFVAGTIPSGLVTKGVYGETLANVDWLHGGAEALLTITNVLIVLGFREALTNPDYRPSDPASSKFGDLPKYVAGAGALLFAAACATGTGLGFEAHSQFLFGAGNLPEATVLGLPFVMHSEPANALSIPTWAIHFSSVFEFLFAMDVIWKFAEATDNPKWKGLTWGMLPLHASGICACTYHFFYNPSSLQFLVELQAFLTLLGNTTVAIAAYRIATSNGWTLKELNPFPKGEVSPDGIALDEAAALPYNAVAATESEVALFAKLTALTLVCSYVLKYGELAFDLPLTENALAAGAIVAGIPAATGYFYYNRGREEGGAGLTLPGFGGQDGEGGLSMADVKKYGVSGTVAYVLTELAFWAVAFPAASAALYRTTGHWPDVVADAGDRAAVLAFVFGAANVARAVLPLRLGAAVALAPWVDANLINREES